MESTSAPFYSIAFIPRGVSPRDTESLVDVSDSVYGIEVVDHERKKDTCRITLDNHLLDKLDSPIWRRGSKFRVIYGHADRRSPARLFVVTKISGGRTLSVEMTGREAIMDTAKVRRVFTNVRRSDVIKRIAAEYGYSAEFIEDTEHIFESLSQPNITDFAFVNRLARKEGFQFWLDENGFHFKERKVGERPLRTLIYHVDPLKGDIIDFSFENEIRGKPARVTMKGRDPLNRENFAVSKDNNTDPNRDVMSSAAVTSAEEAIISFSQGDNAAAFSASKAALDGLNKDSASVNAGSEDVPTAAHSKSEVEAEAKGRFRRVQQSITKLRLQIRGDATILAKNVILITGMGSRFSGRWYVQGATHALSAGSGYVTDLALSTDGVNGASGSRGLSAEQRASLQSCLADLGFLLSEEQAANPNANTQLGLQLAALIKRIENVLSGSAARVGRIAQFAVETMYDLLNYGRRTNDGNLVAAITGCLEATRPITVVSVDFEANTGNVNTKEALDDDELEPIIILADGDTAAAAYAAKQKEVAQTQTQGQVSSEPNSSQPAEEILESREVLSSYEVEFKKRK